MKTQNEETHKIRKKSETITSAISDREIVRAILNRDARITQLYLYEKCYPLFKARYDKYYTDCESCTEFINEIYTYIMTPGVKTGKCYLSTFGFSCSLTCWLKIVIENYCRQLFKKRIEITEISEEDSDRNLLETSSPNMSILTKKDVEIILNLMPNKRYRDLIRFRYIEEKSNEETANILGMSMDNYYNKHKLAKEQFVKILRKEGII
ncbi:MAG: sigma-70 family RNA polymerase sigma factor [Bacteroidales bacterium]|nr:sigma-70 family RNA polymerase sigma factor [Bacteroidales bacterium]